jgi:single-stranded-DNA-specific exonuclease
MSACIMYIFLKRMNRNIKIKPLFHSGKQHGISDAEIFKYLKTQSPSLLITPDSSSNDVKECKRLKELGWDILICDHHESEKNNPYATVINNKLGNVKNIYGSGGLVTWQMCAYINKQLCRDLIPYVAISLIGDSMTMTDAENYTFTYYGKKKLVKPLIPFIEKLNRGEQMSNKSYSFGCITNINSLIRLGNMEEKEELFYALCGVKDSENIIERCKYYHTQQSKEVEKLLKVVEIRHNGNFVIGHLQDKTTLTGLVANKMLSEYGKPIFLVHLGDDCYSGSVRSPIDLKDICNDSGLFYFNQGHNNVYGTSYSVENEQAIIDYLDSRIDDYTPCEDVIYSSTIQSLPNDLYGLTEAYKHIYGKDIELPRFHIQPFTINSSSIKILGANKRTLKITYENVDFMLFNVSNNTKERLHIGECVDIKFECIGELGLNFYMGRTKKQVLVDKFEVEVVEEEDIWKIFD